MKKLTILLAILALSATAALAQIDIELAIDPTEASPGDDVAVFAGISNLGDEAVVAEIEVYATFGEWEFGPLMGYMPLAAGEEISKEIVLVVPYVPYSGDLVVSVTATAGDFSDTAEVTLTIIVEEGAAAGGADLGDVAQVIFDQIVPDNSELQLDISSIKCLY